MAVIFEKVVKTFFSGINTIKAIVTPNVPNFTSELHFFGDRLLRDEISKFAIEGYKILRRGS